MHNLRPAGSRRQRYQRRRVYQRGQLRDRAPAVRDGYMRRRELRPGERARSGLMRLSPVRLCSKRHGSRHRQLRKITLRGSPGRVGRCRTAAMVRGHGRARSRRIAISMIFARRTSSGMNVHLVPERGEEHWPDS